MLAYFAVIRSNFYYKDDIRRALTGHKSWVGSSRFISEIFSVFLHTNFYLNDISPVTQTVSIFLLALMSFLLAYIFGCKSGICDENAGQDCRNDGNADTKVRSDGKLSKLLLLASTFAGLSPFYIENISYKFDSPYMALSMLLGVLPFVFAGSRVLYFTVSFISLVLICSSYQAANSVYIVVAIFLAFKMLKEGARLKTLRDFVLISILSYAASLLFFRIFIMIPTSATISERSTDVLSVSQLAAQIPLNFISYAKAVTSGFGNYWIKICTVISIILFSIISAAPAKVDGAVSPKNTAEHEYRDIQKGRSLKSPRGLFDALTFAFFALVTLILAFSLSFGAYLIIGNTLIADRAFLGFDVFICLLCMFNIYSCTCALTLSHSDKSDICGFHKKILPVVKTVTVCLFYGLFVCATVKGNLYTKQQEYQNFRYTLLMSDLSHIVDPNKRPTLYISGDLGAASSTYMENKNYKFNLGTTSSGWANDLVLRWNMNFNVESDGTVNFDESPELKNTLLSLPLLSDSYYHSIFGNSEICYVILKKPQVKEYRIR
ncbi:glucosyltransferase domain-containing protein [Treponema socranskii]|uniref:glucosyltransferase domain-containing protein n=1 Tax=Treponema socranskii TaxID=53419 RepID=UPI003D6DCD94